MRGEGDAETRRRGQECQKTLHEGDALFQIRRRVLHDYGHTLDNPGQHRLDGIHAVAREVHQRQNVVNLLVCRLRLHLR